MDKKLFERLTQSMGQVNEIIDGKRKPAAQTIVTSVQVKAIRHTTGLSQTKFAKLIDVNVATLQNWEQGRRDPTGPAKALLRAIERDPEHVISALASGH
ncbi:MULTISPECIES: NadS family protein [unclassified Brenneria]|uniref:NadS family protein n=1 Tax=unclassified Brenneria TaxID=2634434 RepID=UPI0018F0C7A4|nr:NadS family protein [Brenneria sp. L3-3C-1]MBJ7222695.1 helix-turn-helix domain-containing protein [Brenneria sp. L3-3C-1]MEE3643938.1 NadS family protein [Brenneria sp. L3_3C_1]